MDDVEFGGSEVPEPSTALLLLVPLAWFLYKRGFRAAKSGLLVVVVSAGISLPMSAQVLRRINSLTAVPDYSYIGRRQTVTVMAAVEPNVDLIRDSITLVELAPDGRTLRTIGLMYDDGTKGDAVAGDYTYTVQLEFFEPVENIRRFKASAAYKRTITRVQSQMAQVRFASAAFAEPSDAGSLVREGNTAEFPVNELVVHIASNVDFYSTALSLASATGGRVAGQVPSIRLALLKYSTVKSIAELALKEAALKSNPAVVSVTRNHIATVNTFANDMTDLKPSGKTKAYERVHAFEAWEFLDGIKESIFPCDPSIASCVPTVIGVIDTGVRSTHREFTGVPIHALNIGADSDSFSGDGHGTAVAGIIGARNHRTASPSPIGHMNGIVGGVPGAGGGSRIAYGLEVGNYSSAFLFHTVTSAENAIANSARVINLSFGTLLASARSEDSWKQAPNGKVGAIYFWIERRDWSNFFDEHPNVTFVVAAGNDDIDAQNIYPGGIDRPNVITVGAIDISGTEDGRRSVWEEIGCTGAGCTRYRQRSGYGASVDIAAPGELIYAPSKRNDDVYTEMFGGTSGAAPFVTGAAALLLAIRPSLTPPDIMQILKDTADPLTTDRPIGNLLNIHAAALFVARPVDVFMLTDMTGSFSDDLAVFKSQASALVDGLAEAGLDAYVGLGRFEDYPISPYGDAWYGDRAYTRVTDLLPVRKWDPSAALNKTNLLNAIGSLSTRSGNDSEEAQLPALYQATTGEGQSITPGTSSLADIAAGQQANFRPNSLRIIVLWTDAPFHEGFPYPGPSWAATLSALNAKSIKVIGIRAGGSGGAWSHLTRVAQGTGTLAGKSGVDCNGDGTIDVNFGAPMVCTISTNGSGIKQAIINSVISLAK